MSTATTTAKIKSQNGFLRPLHNLDDLLNGRNFILYNGQLIYKNGKGYLMTDISEEQEYTVDDYMQLPESAPFQLIHGKLTYMPSPKDIHQHISFTLGGNLFNYLRKNPIGIVRQAPMDVHFDKKNVFQPDILFISNERKHILKDWVYGAPDLVVEILSKSTESIDRNKKMETYGKYNVLEYWIISSEEKTLEVFLNQNGVMVSDRTLLIGNTLTSSVLPGFAMEVAAIFE